MFEEHFDYLIMVKLVNDLGVKRSNKKYTEDRINNMEMINVLHLTQAFLLLAFCVFFPHYMTELMISRTKW